MKLNKSVIPGMVFQCQECGRCCSKDTEGFVFVYQTDIDKMCGVLGLSLEEFAEKYLQITEYEFTVWDEDLEDTGQKMVIDTLVLLAPGVDEDCVFLYEEDSLKRCRIYGGRPLQCRLFPFWSMIMESDVNFKKTLTYCPGINSTKIDKNNSEAYFNADQIEQLVKEERKAEYDYLQQMKHNKYDIKKIYPYLYTDLKHV